MGVVTRPAIKCLNRDRLQRRRVVKLRNQRIDPVLEVTVDSLARLCGIGWEARQL
jgi:hypothetical protein